jgi:hypothetical protein
VIPPKLAVRIFRFNQQKDEQYEKQNITDSQGASEARPGAS